MAEEKSIDVEVAESLATCGSTCPSCTGINVIAGRTIFVELGEYNGKQYEQEGAADTFICRDCGFKYADVTAFNLTKGKKDL